MNLITTWGYTIINSHALGDLITPEEFNSFTAGKYSGDARIESDIMAASMGVRNFCGWHVGPSLACSMSERLLSENGRIKRVGPDLIVQLPATYVTDISGVKIGGVQHSDYALDHNGIVHIFDVGWYEVSRKTEVAIAYTAGLQAGMLDSIKELVANRVVHALNNSSGVTSESAGGVSITYNSSWINDGGAGSIASLDAETLKPYQLKGVF